jgi:anti-sigma factor RsiW
MALHPTTLTCKEVVELVSELLDGALDAHDRVRLEQHLLVCPPCTTHVGQVKATIVLTAGLARPVEVDPQLVEVFRSRKRAGRP